MPRPPASHLNLWKKNLGHVPDSVWEQVGLETLVLADSGLSEVSERIGRLKRLHMLDLGHNELTREPDALEDLDGRLTFCGLDVGIKDCRWQTSGNIEDEVLQATV